MGSVATGISIFLLSAFILILGFSAFTATEGIALILDEFIEAGTEACFTTGVFVSFEVIVFLF